ncbi:MAG: hypothetical protein U9R54_09370, partial [Bacteroidota bacterium]|nr:hypothetical protein [Bacteroidota bacterium]
MKKIYNYISKNFPFIFRGLLFILTIIFIVFLFPRKGKFKYEFQKGNPWLYETMISPFDFPIHKSASQIENERDSLIRNIKPYFWLDSTLLEKSKQKFLKSYKLKKKNFISKNFESHTGSKYVNFISNSEKFYEFAQKLLFNVYSKGIIESPEIISKYNSEYIVILRNKIAKNVLTTNIYTQKLAYSYSIKEMNMFLENLDNNKNFENDFFRQIDLYKYILPNIFFDKKTTENVKHELLDDVSLTKGMVQAGKRIISKGEVVNSKTFLELNSLKKESEKKLGLGNNSKMIFLGHLIFIIVSITVLFLFLWNFRKEILQDSLKTSFILILVLIIVGISSITIKYNIDLIYIIPFAI